MDYPCAKFAISLSHFGFIVQTETHRITDVDDCYTHVTTVGVRK